MDNTVMSGVIKKEVESGTSNATINIVSENRTIIFSKKQVCITILLIVSYIYSTIAAHPNYTSYFNIAAGKNPEEILADNDLDSGQETGQVIRILKEQNILDQTLIFSALWTNPQLIGARHAIYPAMIAIAYFLNNPLTIRTFIAKKATNYPFTQTSNKNQSQNQQIEKDVTNIRYLAISIWNYIMIKAELYKWYGANNTLLQKCISPPKKLLNTFFLFENEICW